jgi:hypothetical protein
MTDVSLSGRGLCTCRDGACPSCGGTGWRPCAQYGTHTGANCPFCGGTGQRVCEWCRGSGRHAACGGTGRLTRGPISAPTIDGLMGR